VAEFLEVQKQQIAVRSEPDRVAQIPDAEARPQAWDVKSEGCGVFHRSKSLSL
jgi:hypothetical protein